MKESELHSLIVQVQQGDSRAFEKIYDAYSPALFGICKKVLNDTELAEDVLQDAFIKIWQKVKIIKVLIRFCIKICGKN